ncbi:MAG: hypothetical protein WBP38_02485 [Hyphomicrobium sp.]
MYRLGLIVVLALAACDKPQSEAYTAEHENNFIPVAVELQLAEGAQRIDGTATLLIPDALTLLNAELRAAEVASAFSQRTVERFKDTRTLGEQRVDNAERQAAVDATQLALLELRLRNAWGDRAPFLDAEKRQQLVDELSSGKTTLIRLDFPQSVEQDPRNVRVAPLGGGEVMQLTAVWAAPSGNLAMPGTSFFGIMPTGPGLRPGDRAKVTAERSAPTSGVIVPASAVVVFAGESWCFVETQPGQFERKRLSLAIPVGEGYLTNEFAVGTKVAVYGASVLLAREAGPGVLDDDDVVDESTPSTKKPADEKEQKSDQPTVSQPVASTDSN